jgi:hypothetical protein
MSHLKAEDVYKILSDLDFSISLVQKFFLPSNFCTSKCGTCEKSPVFLQSIWQWRWWKLKIWRICWSSHKCCEQNETDLVKIGWELWEELSYDQQISWFSSLFLPVLCLYASFVHESWFVGKILSRPIDWIHLHLNWTLSTRITRVQSSSERKDKYRTFF